MYVLDSSAIIELIEKTPRGERVENFMRDTALVTTSICMHEVMAGATSKEEFFIFEGLFATMQVLDHTKEAAKEGAKIEQDLTRTGNLISARDILIAGICKARGGEIVTFDKGFTKIKGLKSHVLE